MPELTDGGQQTVTHILERLEYVGHTVNFRTRRKSHKHKKRIDNPMTEWQIFENTHEAIISKEYFDLVQELRKNKRKIQKCEEVNPFSGMVYCADCGAKMYLCRARTLAAELRQFIDRAEVGGYNSVHQGCEAV